MKLGFGVCISVLLSDLPGKVIVFRSRTKEVRTFFVILCPILDTKSLWMAVRIKKHRGQPDGLSPFRFEFSERREESPGSAEHFAF